MGRGERACFVAAVTGKGKGSGRVPLRLSLADSASASRTEPGCALWGWVWRGHRHRPSIFKIIFLIVLHLLINNTYFHCRGCQHCLFHCQQSLFSRDVVFCSHFRSLIARKITSLSTIYLLPCVSYSYSGVRSHFGCSARSQIYVNWYKYLADRRKYVLVTGHINSLRSVCT